MEYLLDTDWIAAYLRATPAFVTAVDDRRAAGIAMSVVTLAALIIAIATINAWNRLNVTTRQVAGSGPG